MVSDRLKPFEHQVDHGDMYPGFPALGALRHLLLVVGERLAQVFNEAITFTTDLFGVDAALGLAEGHHADLHGRDGELGALGAGRVLGQFCAQGGSDMVISMVMAALPLIIIPHRYESYSRGARANRAAPF